MSAVIKPETWREAALRLTAPARVGGYKLQALHEYRAADGTLSYCRIRLRHPISSVKRIRPLYFDGVRYAIVEPPAPESGKLLYRLPELVATDPMAPVFIVEGEWCADVLKKLGLVATTSGSASSAGAADWSPLRGRIVIIWPDNDDPGRKYGKDVVAKLLALDCKVEVVDITALSLPEHGDVVDWLATHPNATAAHILALARKAEGLLDQVELIEATLIRSEPIRWLWSGWMARGKLHVLAGAPGTGKTTIALHLAACVSAGRPFPSGSRSECGNVLIWSGEDDPADTLVPRLRAAGANLERIKLVGEVTENGERFPFDPARDVDKLAAAAARCGDVALLIVDPLVSAVLGDSHKNAEVRRGLAPLVTLAARLNAALVGITHYSKGTQGRDPLERVTGSVAFGALARIVFGTVQQQTEAGEPRRMMFARAKSNIGPDGGGYTYTISQTEIGDGIVASRLVWGGSVDGTARELLAEAEEVARDPAESGECSDWLREELKGGERDAAEMKRDGAKLGYTPKVIRRAREKLRIRPRKSTFSGGWVWALSAGEVAQDAQDAKPENVGTFGESGHLRAPPDSESIEI